jgi:uncharacterized damage-inducible protein DinB
MATTIPYSQFIGSNDPWPVLESTAERIRELTEALPRERITAPPLPGKWSIHQIVAHLADAEIVHQVRIRFILFEDNPPLPAWDQERWMNGWMREGETFEQSLERFRVVREATVRLLRSATEHDLRRTGVHAERGVQTAGDFIVLIAGHDINHISQIRGIATGSTSA